MQAHNAQITSSSGEVAGLDKLKFSSEVIMAGEIILTVRQILILCEFVGIAIDVENSSFSSDGEEYLLETEYAVAQNQHGAVSYLYDYPEEGGYPLSGDPRLFKERAEDHRPELNALLSPHVKSHVDGGAIDKSNILGFRRMPAGYALMLNADYSHYYWVRYNGEESVIHWDKWAVYRWAKHDSGKER